MPFIHTYKEAIKHLDEIKSGACEKNCRAVWMRHLKYALKTKTNPLGLTAAQRVRMTARIADIYGRKVDKNKYKTQKKYNSRPSPPYPANNFCNLEMKGNDGNMYKSLPNKINVYAWKRLR